MDGRNERAVDLDLVGSDVREHAQGRIARFQNHRSNAHADIAKHRQDQRLKLALGKSASSVSSMMKRSDRPLSRRPGDERRHELQIAGLLCRNVDADGCVRPECLVETIDRSRSPRRARNVSPGRSGPSSMASPMKPPGGWISPFSSRQRTKASNPTTSCVLMSTLGWNAQQNLRSRMARRKSLLQLHARGAALSHVRGRRRPPLPFESLLALYMALSAFRRTSFVAASVLRIHAHADRRRTRTPRNLRFETVAFSFSRTRSITA